MVLTSCFVALSFWKLKGGYAGTYPDRMVTIHGACIYRKAIHLVRGWGAGGDASCRIPPYYLPRGSLRAAHVMLEASKSSARSRAPSCYVYTP